jgi:hypothetical protein
MQIIENLQESENKELTGNTQHGFKNWRNNTIAGLTIHPILQRAPDNNKYEMMSSLDFSPAFDVVNVKLLLKKTKDYPAT